MDNKDDKHILAMKLIVEFRKMKDLCRARSKCIGCPYLQGKLCDILSTDQMIETVSDVFEVYLCDIDK